MSPMKHNNYCYDWYRCCFCLYAYLIYDGSSSTIKKKQKSKKIKLFVFFYYNVKKTKKDKYEFKKRFYF